MNFHSSNCYDFQNNDGPMIDVGPRHVELRKSTRVRKPNQILLIRESRKGIGRTRQKKVRPQVIRLQAGGLVRVSRVH
jgi:hypothetical protein